MIRSVCGRAGRFLWLSLLLVPSSADALESATSTISEGTRTVITDVKVTKGGCYLWDVYVQGFVTTQNGLARVSGASVTGTLSSSDDIDFVWYFDHSSYFGGGCYYCHYPNGQTQSRAISDHFGFYELRFDLCIDDDAYNWDADFSLCAEKSGFNTSCILASFDEGDDFDERSFFLVPVTTPTPTPTVTPSLTVTPTLSLTPTSSPSPTSTLSGQPPAAYPAFDANQNGIIGPEDLFLFLKDWKHQAK